MRMPPWNSALKLRYLPPKHITLTRQKRQSITARATRAAISPKGRSLLQARKKIAKCTQHCSRIRSSESTTPICFMKYTIEMRWARKTTFIHIRCRERGQPKQRMQKIWLRIVGPRRSHKTPLRRPRCMIPRLLIRSIQSWNLMERALTKVAWLGHPLIINIEQVV